MTTITRENAEIKSFITGFLSDPAHDNQSSDSLLANVFRIALASLEAEPVAWTDDEELRDVERIGCGYILPCPPDKYADPHRVIPLYREPPAPVVPDEIEPDDSNTFDYVDGWNACRAAMLQAGNFRENKNSSTNNFREISETSTCSPVIPDGWISCSERMPEKNQNVLISVNFDSSLVEPLICSARYTGSTFRRGEATIKPGNDIEQATHWMPLPEPPQEVNRG
ncbi:DUF551 domain-containing protein [Escherichia coli]|nr:DUF551 domain-containing protein [Escherichia coli]